MRSLRLRLIGWVRSRLGGGDRDADMAEEIRLHIEQRIAKFVAQGLSPDQARAAAYQQFGPVEPVKEACRDERRRAIWIGTVWQDLRYGTRSLVRDRAFTVAALFTLTLGVGLVTVFFTIFNGILLKPWPLPEPETLVTATHGVSPAAYRYLRERVTAVDLVGIAQTCGSSIDDDHVRTSIRCVSGNYFDVLRVPLIQGRGFRPEEDVVGAPEPVAVIGYGLWRDRFSMSSDTIGQTIRLNQMPFRIVGIGAQGATDKPGPNLPRLWVPLAAYPLVASDSEFNQGFLTNPEYCCVDLAGRLRERRSEAVASAQLTGLHREFRGAGNELALTVTGTSEILQPWENSAVAVIGLMASGILLVLLVACANTGNLQLARGSRREPEFLVRLALGASRGRIVRQLLTEGLLIAGAAAALSLAFAVVLTAFLTRWMWETRWMPEGRADGFGIDVSPDWRVAFVTMAIAAVAVLGTGLGPVLRGTRRLVASGRSPSTLFRTRGWFLVIQVALSAVLVVGASLLARALLRAGSLDPGFDAAGVARVGVTLPSGASREARLQALRAILREALTGAEPPLIAEAGSARATAGKTLEGVNTSYRRSILARAVSSDYVRLLRIPLREGRLLDDDDTASEVVVNETFARRVWPGRSAVGGTFSFDGPRLVVGVIGDVRPIRPGTPVPLTFFERGSGATLYLRNDPAVIERARAALRTADPTAELLVSPLSDDYEQGLEGMRIVVTFAWAIGLVALLLAATGIFGVFALVAEERRREVGIRVALGGGARAIVRMMVAHAGRAIGLGLVLGFLAALLAAPLLRSYLAGVGPYDPVAFAVAALVLASAATVATVVPVRRAMRVDPAVTLRAE